MSSDVPVLETNYIIDCDFARFKVKKLLGQGGFGSVYLVEECVSHKKYAVKTEIIPGPNDTFQPLLPWEETILLAIQELPKENYKKHFVKIADRGIIPPLRFMIMTLVGKSLYDIKDLRPLQCFTENTCWRIAIQTLEAFEAFQEAGFVHRDIKPQNYTIGSSGQEDVIFMLDFGLVRCYTGKKYPTAGEDKPNFAGTVRYCSRSSHYNVYQFPKDDLESWVLSLLELHDNEAIFWRCIDKRSEVGIMKNDLFLGQEPSKIFNYYVPPLYKKLVKAVGDLTPANNMTSPTPAMQKKVNLVPIYDILNEIGKTYKYSNSKVFDWQKTDSSIDDNYGIAGKYKHKSSKKKKKKWF
uniref:non-specific serine/threonine protein kinase n=1 Tax=Parastrongyloides trichosuri TaxID=131310 RepID=A0A0N4Z0Q0_PARTI